MKLTTLLSELKACWSYPCSQSTELFLYALDKAVDAKIKVAVEEAYNKGWDAAVDSLSQEGL